MELPTTDGSLSYYLTSDNLTIDLTDCHYLTSYFLTDALVVGHAVERPVDRSDAAEPQVLQPQQQ